MSFYDYNLRCKTMFTSKVFEQIENGCYTILPNNIATGKVFKIKYDGNLYFFVGTNKTHIPII